MLVNDNYRHEKIHVIGGSGIFDTVLNIVKKIGPKLLSSAANAAASEAGKQIVSRIAAPAHIPTSTGTVATSDAAQQRAIEILNKYKSHGSAIDIRDYVRGSGIKVV